MRYVAQERGSISVLIIGLFVLTVALIMVMADISSLVISRKALTQQTEFLVQQGAQEIDLAAYYQGSGDLASYIAEKAFVNQNDPGVPLDCDKSRALVFDAAQKISHERFRNFELLTVECALGLISIETRADAIIPFRLPFFGEMNLGLQGFATSSPERRNGFWLKGLRIW